MSETHSWLVTGFVMWLLGCYLWTNVVKNTPGKTRAHVRLPRDHWLISHATSYRHWFKETFSYFGGSHSQRYLHWVFGRLSKGYHLVPKSKLSCLLPKISCIPTPHWPFLNLFPVSKGWNYCVFLDTFPVIAFHWYFCFLNMNTSPSKKEYSYPLICIQASGAL